MNKTWVAWDDDRNDGDQPLDVVNEWELEANEPKKLAGEAPLCALATLAPGTHLDASGLASVLGVCKKTVERATRRGELPAPFRLNGRNTWMVSAIIAHFEDRQKAVLLKQQQRVAKLNKAS
jgi:hypothetical protein